MTFFRSVAAAEDLLQEILLGLSGFGARARLWIRRPRGRRTWIHSSAGKKSLDQRLRAPTHLAAGGAGNGSVQKRNGVVRSEEHTSELQSLRHLVCRLLLEK